jgi:hypothetical protein
MAPTLPDQLMELMLLPMKQNARTYRTLPAPTLLNRLSTLLTLPHLSMSLSVVNLFFKT